MLKKEWIYREIMYQALEKEKNLIKQSYLSERCGVSLGHVNKSVKPLEEMNAIEKKPQGFLVINPKKILLYWASLRRLRKDVVYETRVEKRVEEIEKELPPVIFTAYSGYKQRFGSVPSDYSEVVVYGARERMEKRFPKKEGKVNLIVLKKDEHLEKIEKATKSQLFVDLWNLDTWYAQEFLEELEKRLW